MIRVKARDIAISPRKVAIVTDLIRGRSYEDALEIMAHTPRRAARPVTRLLRQGGQVAKTNRWHQETVMIEEIFVTPGSRQRRWRPKARGQANPYQKKTCHIYLKLSGQARAGTTAKARLVTAKSKKEDLDGTKG